MGCPGETPTKGRPHSPQYLLVAALSAPHFEHIIHDRPFHPQDSLRDDEKKDYRILSPLAYLGSLNPEGALLGTCRSSGGSQSTVDRKRAGSAHRTFPCPVRPCACSRPHTCIYPSPL